MQRLRTCFLCTGLGAGLLFADPSASMPTSWPESYPDWWYDADPAKSMVDVSKLDDPGNTSPILQGQLLHMADIGIQELNEQLASIGGAGFTVDDFKDPGKDPAYDSPANIGQLKFVSSKFYDRFAEIGYQPGAAGWNSDIVLNEGAGDNSLLYPWRDDQTPENLSIALIGQAKHLFSWNVQSWFETIMQVDDDGDKLPDYWEEYWFGQSSGSVGAFVDSDGDGFSDYIEFLGEMAPNAESEPLSSEISENGADDVVLVVIGRGVYGVQETSAKSSLIAH